MKWLVYGKGFCCRVETDENDIIITTAPILINFLGHKMESLRKWKRVEKVEVLYGKEDGEDM